jgi:hypothetical protein
VSFYRVVKEEISDDNARLPCFNGRVVSWVRVPTDDQTSPSLNLFLKPYPAELFAALTLPPTYLESQWESLSLLLLESLLGATLSELFPRVS